MANARSRSRRTSAVATVDLTSITSVAPANLLRYDSITSGGFTFYYTGDNVEVSGDITDKEFHEGTLTVEENAYIADLEPGDGLYYPNMWWHEVEAFDRFNVLVNFWWMTAEPFLGSPMDVLMHAMMSVRDRPAKEKEAWKALFDYYIFDDPEQVRAHLPPESHGAFATMDDNLSRQLRAMLRNNLNR